mmetsp:Transcript_110184/g.200386  ORF Transcript_110184/g.200386 Transcript_110184/m.200386 type:complete len:135 (-) Transcript_110184:57-461(-)
MFPTSSSVVTDSNRWGTWPLSCHLDDLSDAGSTAASYCLLVVSLSLAFVLVFSSFHVSLSQSHDYCCADASAEYTWSEAWGDCRAVLSFAIGGATCHVLRQANTECEIETEVETGAAGGSNDGCLRISFSTFML